MKKILLSLAAAVIASTAFADTVTYDFTTNNYGLNRGSVNTEPYVDYVEAGTKIENGLSSITMDKTKGKGFRLWTESLRVYSGDCSMDIAVGGLTINKVVLTTTNTTALGNTDAPLTINNEQIEFVDKTYTWEGEAASVKIEFHPKSTARLGSVTIDYTPAAAGEKEPAGLSFNKSSFIVPDFQKSFKDAVLSNPNDLEVTYSSSNPEVAEIYEDYVKVNSIGTTVITAESAETDKFAAGTASYTLKVVAGANTLAKMLELAPNKNDVVYFTGEFVVVFASGNYVYVTDAADAPGLLYGNNNYKTGDLIPGGWEAKNSIYNGLQEWSGTFPEASGTTVVYYEDATSITMNDLNRVVWLKGIVFEDQTPAADNSVEITLPDGSKATLFNKFKLAQEEAGTYNVLVAVTLYKDAIQLYPCEYVDPASVKEPELPETLNITTDGDEINIKKDIDVLGDPAYYITGNTTKDDITVTVETPEGWSYVLFLVEVDDNGNIEPFTRANDPFWTPVSMMKQFGCTEGPSFKVPADGFESEVPMYLVYNDQANYGNPITFYVKVDKKGDATGVAAVEAAEEAVYYNLQGVKIENPVEGIYVKVANGKATKVVL